MTSGSTSKMKHDIQHDVFLATAAEILQKLFILLIQNYLCNYKKLISTRATVVRCVECNSVMHTEGGGTLGFHPLEQSFPP